MLKMESWLPAGGDLQVMEEGAQKGHHVTSNTLMSVPLHLDVMSVLSGQYCNALAFRQNSMI